MSPVTTPADQASRHFQVRVLVAQFFYAKKPEMAISRYVSRDRKLAKCCNPWHLPGVSQVSETTIFRCLIFGMGVNGCQTDVKKDQFGIGGFVYIKMTVIAGGLLPSSDLRSCVLKSA